MNRKSTAQEYYTLMIDKNGLMPAMHRDEAGAGLAASAFMDLTVNDIVVVEKKKITVIKDLPDSLEYLENLYTYLKEKPRHMEKMMTDFYAGSRNKKLAEKIGESLCKDGAAVEEKGGLFAPKRVFIPEKAYKDELIGMIRSAVQEEEMAPCDVALVWLLQQTNCLKQYFSKHESDQLKQKLKEMKKDPQNKQLAEMIDYVSDMTAVMAVLIVTSMN
mgnify:FL=1